MERSLKESLFSLVGMQIFAYLLPLLLIPYLIKTIGFSHVGEIAVATSICTLLSLVVEYGFTLYGTRRISIAKAQGQHQEIADIFFTILQWKLILLLAITPLYAVYVVMYIDGYAARGVYASSYFIVVAQAISTVWFFQGMEQMRYALIYTVAIRSASVLLIFAMVHAPEEYYLVPVIQGLSGVLISVLMLKDAVKIASLKYVGVSRLLMKQAFVDAAPLFGTSIMASAIASGGVVVLASFSQSHELIGIYSTYEKIMRAAQSLFSPVTQAMFPLSSRLLNTNLAEGRRLLRRTLIALFGLASLFVICAYLAAEYLVGRFFGSALAQHSAIVLLFAPWFIAGICNNVTGTQYLVASGKSGKYLKFMGAGAVVTLITQIVLVKPMGIQAIAIGMSMGESLLFVLLIAYYLKAPATQSTSLTKSKYI